MTLRRLAPENLPIETRALARALLGCILVRDSTQGLTAGRIVETEAYLPGDPACHAFRGKSARNATLFGPPHRAYVYQIYGTSFCFNLSSERNGEGAGVLVRALEPIEGLKLMQRRRATQNARDLCRGPGRLCQALAIDRSLDGVDLSTHPHLWLADGGARAVRVRRSPRVGVTQAAERRLRFYAAGSPFVSGAARLNPA
ncbi:MAG: DNA-3-methyladenine glycosylase [Candidatus Eremiobacteraeota bacterium]|nr:DNA-3-methyladenine glycosylase [Candidatus Eremiobacteraeota bacterium]